MRKMLSVLLALCMAFVLTACGESDEVRKQTVNQTQTVNDVLNAAAGGTGELTSQPPVDPDMTVSAAYASGDYDVDLTQLSSTMVYTEVFNMMSAPENYVGKTVKMRGTLTIFEGEEKNYFSCLIADATACCAQGIEFDWAGDHKYPDDYPPEGSEITVTGTFDTYVEGNFIYCTLVDAELYT